MYSEENHNFIKKTQSRLLRSITIDCADNRNAVFMSNAVRALSLVTTSMTIIYVFYFHYRVHQKSL